MDDFCWWNLSGVPLPPLTAAQETELVAAIAALVLETERAEIRERWRGRELVLWRELTGKPTPDRVVRPAVEPAKAKRVRKVDEAPRLF